MVIGYFNVFWSEIGPDETYTILIVDSNAVLSLPATKKRFKLVARWNL